MAATKSQLHVAMFPWFAFGHFIPYLHLSNKLAERGHRVSFLLPKGSLPKLHLLNTHPDLVEFFPVTVSSVDGLPVGAETASDLHYSIHTHLATAFDQTKDQVRAMFSSIKPDIMLYDLACWIPSLGREFRFKSVMYSVLCAATTALRIIPFEVYTEDATMEEMMRATPGYPSTKVVPRADFAAMGKGVLKELGSGMTLCARVLTSVKESDALAFRTMNEVEGPVCEYLGAHFMKSVLLTGPVMSEAPGSHDLEDKWRNWLENFAAGSVVFCTFGSQIKCEEDQFQEILLGFEATGMPFLVALTPPDGCATIEEALPEGFQERVKGRGWIDGGWVPQTEILNHRSVGCFVSHCGFGSMWESLLSDCQIVLVPHLPDQILNAMIMSNELEVAVEVERDENGWIPKEKLVRAIQMVMDEESEVGVKLKSSHGKWREIVSNKEMQEEYVDTFISNLQTLSMNK